VECATTECDGVRAHIAVSHQSIGEPAFDQCGKIIGRGGRSSQGLSSRRAAWPVNSGASGGYHDATRLVIIGLFAYITQNWRGKPLVSHQVIVQLIGSTKTDKGLQVSCGIDANLYPRGIKVSDREMQSITITRDEFHGTGTIPSRQTNNLREAVISRRILSGAQLRSRRRRPQRR